MKQLYNFKVNYLKAVEFIDFGSYEGQWNALTYSIPDAVNSAVLLFEFKRLIVM